MATAAQRRWPWALRFDREVASGGWTVWDERGWLHIDRTGRPIYVIRFRSVEPFYNGQALVELLDGGKAVLDE